MELKPGVNTLKLVVQNGSDTLSFQYSIFYYDEKNPIVAMYLGDKTTGQGQDLLYGDQPVMTEDSDTANLFVQMMVPDNAGVPFQGSAVVKLDSIVPTIEFGEGLTLGSSGAVELKRN
ncbi:hypothetical protein ACFTAO_43830 [Paenibacillus rhizoplanae]